MIIESDEKGELLVCETLQSDSSFTQEESNIDQLWKSREEASLPKEDRKTISVYMTGLLTSELQGKAVTVVEQTTETKDESPYQVLIGRSINQ